MSPLENTRQPADIVECPVDLSRSAANFKTPAHTAALSISQGYHPSTGCGVHAAGTSAYDTASVHVENLISRSASHNSSTFSTACAGNLDGPASSMNTLPLGSAHKVSTVPNSAVCQNSITCDVLYSAVNCDAVVKSEPLSCSSESLYKKISAGSSGCENDSCLQYPKTKKQKAVDGRTLHAEVTASSSANLLSSPTVNSRLSKYETLTFGEIQDRLITKVVESGSLLSGVLCNDQQSVVGTSEHTTGISTGKLPIGRFSQCKTSPVQNRLSLALQMASSECRSLQRAASLPMTSVSLIPREHQSLTTSTQGLWLQDDVLHDALIATSVIHIFIFRFN